MSNRTVIRMSPEQARDWFLNWVAERGFVLPPDFIWVNSRTRYPATCPEGHPCGLLPHCLKAGQGGCRTCGRANAHKAGVARRDGKMRRTDRARLDFLAWVADNGFTLTDELVWKGVAKTYPATCPKGHPCNLRPNSIQQRQGGCLPCGRASRDNPRTSESTYHKARSIKARDEFLAWANAEGYRLQDFQWRGTLATYPAVCPRGHACQPCPGHVRTGVGGCAACKNKVFDVFYVVHNRDACVIKLGITSGDGRLRLRDHARNGFTGVLRVLTGLRQGEAFAMEQELLTLLKLSGVAPVQGREYFQDAITNVVLGYVDGAL